jgi:hypothetical protein
MAIRETNSRSGRREGFEVNVFANIGTGEEFVQQLVIEMLDLADASMIFDPRPRDAILTVSMEGLMPAFEHLKKIRAARSQALPLLNRQQLYEDFTRALWHAYKDLLPKAALAIGYDIGFLFQNDVNFEKGVGVFLAKYPEILPEFTDHLREQRNRWQNDLAHFRNDFLEHRKEDPQVFRDHYEPDHAENMFDAVWRMSADVLAVLLAQKMPPGFSIREIPLEERDPAHPRRFRYVQTGIVSLSDPE